jgi:hypothetical protein
MRALPFNNGTAGRQDKRAGGQDKGTAGRRLVRHALNGRRDPRGTDKVSVLGQSGPHMARRRRLGTRNRVLQPQDATRRGNQTVSFGTLMPTESPMRSGSPMIRTEMMPGVMAFMRLSGGKAAAQAIHGGKFAPNGAQARRGGRQSRPSQRLDVAP